MDKQLEEQLNWFQTILDIVIKCNFKQDCEVASIREIPRPKDDILKLYAPDKFVTLEEQVVLMLALIPHIRPQILDIFFVHNKSFNRPYTEFGGWKGVSHVGFLPTGETAMFIVAGDDVGGRKEVIRLFQKDHWFYTQNILRLEGAGSGEPFMSGQLQLSEEYLSRVLLNSDFKPDYNIGFPAKLITTELKWEDMVLDYQVTEGLEEINTWIASSHTIMTDWGLSKFLKAGYRALFYGPPGTGKTLAATLLGQKNEMDVYRVDLSMIVSKYIGETEKNLAKVFDFAENRNWILFFDEADALFGKRTSTNTSNDRHANQEVAYLLQRIEDFNGTVILATNIRTNIDDAFSRRFQSMIYFPMPNKELRSELWLKMLPKNWLGDNKATLIHMASERELSGGAISNVIRRCALQMLMGGDAKLTEKILKESLRTEVLKK